MCDVMLIPWRGSPSTVGRRTTCGDEATVDRTGGVGERETAGSRPDQTVGVVAVSASREAALT